MTVINHVTLTRLLVSSLIKNDFKKQPDMSDEFEAGGLGRWEEHTKGFGSKMLKKMGLKAGQGLGKNSEGIIEPIKIQPNKGRSTLGSTRSFDDDTKKKDKKPRFDDSSDASDDGTDSDSSVDRSPTFIKEEIKEVEDEDSYNMISKRLLASNKRLIIDWNDKLKEEISKRNLLEKNMDDLQSDLRAQRSLLDDCRFTNNTITHLETINKSDKLDLNGFWSSLPTSISNTTRCQLIQVFALPLLTKHFKRLQLLAQPSPLDCITLENLIFPDIILVAIEWLKTKQYYVQMVDWYEEWMTYLKDMLHLERVRHFRRCWLDIMYLANLDNHRDLNSFRYTKYDEWKASKKEYTERPGPNVYNDDKPQLMSLKALVEETALKQGFLFRPIEGRSHESKQVYKFERLNIYIDNMVIFVRKNGKWLPMNLGDVISLSK